MSDFRLRVFSSVAKNLSFTKASQELFISQPAITKHIQELETMYQTRLFERMGNKILLTDAGRLLLEHCEKILEDYGRLEYEMNLSSNPQLSPSTSFLRVHVHLLLNLQIIRTEIPTSANNIPLPHNAT